VSDHGACGYCGGAKLEAACWWERFAFEWRMIGALAAGGAIVCRRKPGRRQRQLRRRSTWIP